MSSVPVLDLEQLRKAYRAGVHGCTASVEVLRGVTLRVLPGELVALAADPAAGRTTLLLCAAGLLRPDDGQVRWPALPPRPERPPAGIVYVADRPAPYGYLSVREALRHAAEVRELYAPGTSQPSDELLECCALTSVADLRTSLLNAGDRARLLLATALVTGPRLLLLDDVDGGPDGASATSFGEVLRRVTATGVAIVWAGRTTSAARDVDARYQLERGRLTRTGLGSASTLRSILPVGQPVGVGRQRAVVTGAHNPVRPADAGVSFWG